ncbi:MAG: succinyl-CoA synthetase subunit beta [Candidatus Bathyarchaeota archaeon BA1]|nr:MAG: succinyl-CoA synthetase subunit beta [Candidatus Bathyarchaeota archaeon BA1]
MKLFEHEAKAIFSKYGIPTPPGGLATSPSQAREIATRLNTPVAVKAQVLVTGRGKAGGILFARSPAEAELAAGKLLSAEIRGVRVRSVLVEEWVLVKKELYFGITIDRSNRSYVAIASSEGGMEIEEVAAAMPEKIVKVFIEPSCGFHLYHAIQMAKRLGYRGSQMLNLATLFLNQYRISMDYDAELIEMNPLIETPEGKFVAADTRLIIDDSALYRHSEFKERLIEEVETGLTPQELEARKSGLAYVKLEGDIGVIGNGAGLVMATLDIILLYGGNPANFLDVGGGASADKMALALNLVLSDPKVRVVFINILGGITRCDEIAKGILEARRRIGILKPVVIRLMGTNEEEGRRLLTEAGLHVLDSMEEAAKRAVEMITAEG